VLGAISSRHSESRRRRRYATVLKATTPGCRLRPYCIGPVVSCCSWTPTQREILPAKRKRAETLLRRLKARFSPGGLLHHGQGKWYPGEPLPRWALGVHWRADRVPLWHDEALLADTRTDGVNSLDDARRMLDVLVDELKPASPHVIGAYERNDGREALIGFVLPLAAPEVADSATKWQSAVWPFPDDRLQAVAGDSPLGLRLPLASLPEGLPVKTALAAMLMATLAPGASRAADQGGVQAGMLTCQVASGWGFIFGSTKDLKCVFSSKPGVEDHYTGSIGRYGVDIGYTAATVIAWAVLAPSTDVAPGSLAGTYTGATGSATVGGGVGASVVVQLV